MDPAPIGTSQWDEIGQMLSVLWIVVLFIVLAAANLLLGHNLVASLVASNHLGAGWQKVRPMLYTLGIACFGLALFFLSRVVDLSGVLRDFWASYWI